MHSFLNLLDLRRPDGVVQVHTEPTERSSQGPTTDQRGVNYYMPTDPHGVGLLEESSSGRPKRSNKKASDSSSNIDSGVGLHYDGVTHPQVPNSHDPNFNK